MSESWREGGKCKMEGGGGGQVVAIRSVFI